MPTAAHTPRSHPATTKRTLWVSALRDPRHFQIGALAALTLYGVLALRFDLRASHVAAIVATALATQFLLGRRLGLRFDARSPLISSLSLTLLLRGSSLLVLIAAAVLTIASKFWLRVPTPDGRGRHLFNPTAFGIVAVLLLSHALRGKLDGVLGTEFTAWVSPGQWGQAALLAFFLLCLGGLVVMRASRWDVSLGFLAFYSLIVLARAAWLGDPLAVPLHHLESGALLIFAFFMISDPKTTPSSRGGRLAYAGLVALGAACVHFVLFEPNGFLWSLVVLSPTVSLLNRLLPGARYQWPRRAKHVPSHHELLTAKEPSMRHFRFLLPLILVTLLTPAAAQAFCGFYVAKADTQLFNQASQVVLVRDGDRTVLTMANDFTGDLTDFAVVIPVPTFLEREQIHVADKALIDHLDAYTAPRLVEYFDEDPCLRMDYQLERNMAKSSPSAALADGDRKRAKALGVTIEASYTVGEYDILILSAQESRGLTTWLTQNGYRLPRGAEQVVGSYLRQGMRFFVAKVNLEEQAKGGRRYLRPLQVAYESPKFMLPIRLGTVNADGPQELFVYALTRTGRVETTNYRTVKLPSGVEIPPFVKGEFGEFYRALFSAQVERENRQAVFLEYAWDMGWCDPCAADPLSAEELRQLGVFWLPGPDPRPRGVMQPKPTPRVTPAGPQNVFVTRLHVRYDRESFPADLQFQETGDRTNFQGRYVLRHPWKGEASCPAAAAYFDEVDRRQRDEARTLASLTGWELGDIHRKMALGHPDETKSEPWWRRLWGSGG